MAGPGEPNPETDPGPRAGAPEAPSDGIWPYLGVGCLTGTFGIAGGAMIAVLVAKIVGSVQGCVPDGDTRAPCNWLTYAQWGGRIGLVLVPTSAIWRMRRGRTRRINE
jgi:hypothetical protein